MSGDRQALVDCHGAFGRRRSFQFGRASAPIIPHAVRTMRGKNTGTDTSSG